jgi:metallo-beta-lactamase class B
VVYADSLNPVSRDGFRFSSDSTSPSIVDQFQRSIAKIESLPCDIILSVHPGFTGMARKLKLRQAGRADAFIDPNGCREYASDAMSRLRGRIAEELKQ